MSQRMGAAAKSAGTPSPSLGSSWDEARLIAAADRLRTVMIKLRRQLYREDSPGLSIALYSALATVAGTSEMAIGELADAEHLPPSAATRIVDRLEEAGLLLRLPNPLDRRSVHLRVTPDGRHLLDERRRTANLWLARRLARLSPDQWEVVAWAFDVLEGVVLRDLQGWELPPRSLGEAMTPGGAER